MATARLYPLRQSPLFRMGSRKRLAILFGMSPRDLELLADLQPENFKHWELKQSERDRLIGLPKKNKRRKIQQPKVALNAFHKKLALFLGRIEKPDFVFSATKRRSYVENALRHKNDFPCVKVDIREFYQNVRFGAVRRFFREDLECADDIAHLLAILCCNGRTLPTGSPISPVLSYFACRKMFDDIAGLASEHGLIFSLYVDDMVFSGPRASLAFAELVRRKLRNYDFVGHKIVCYRSNDVKVITGVAVSKELVALPFGRQKRIRLIAKKFANAKNLDDAKVLGTALKGQYREAERVRPGMKALAHRVQARMDAMGISPSTPKRRTGRPYSYLGKVFDEMRARRQKMRELTAQNRRVHTVEGEGRAEGAAA